MERRLNVFENRILRRIFEPKRNENGEWRRLYNGTEVTSAPTRPVDNVVIATKGLQDRNINTQAGTTVENKGKLILNV